MRTSKRMGNTRLPVPHGHIELTVIVEYNPADFATGAPVAPNNVFVAFTVVGTIGGNTVDLGVRRDGVPVRRLAADIDGLVDTEPVAGLVAEYRRRLADVTVALAGLGIATGDGVAVAFSVDDLEFLRHCLTLTELRWREAITQAETDARQPQRDEPAPPGFIDIRPTPSGFLSAARLFGVELARVEKLTTRVGGLLGLARDTADTGEDPQ